MNPWQGLAEAIVIQAADDYRRELTLAKYFPERHSPSAQLELERFFLSEWYRGLTDVPGEMIMNRIKGEVYGSFANTTNS